ncbi:importin subunit alpha-9 isoform X1 [Vigna radiata var. radiata]|uniref:Importin subunit alpha n=1 Tax=Vigna radiata var. radiata TaxID=3916 RepID=A0A1S3T7F8_VIGRR|nr:importin subunit alpha-9 isoform X1 [Vigna radiata var. radiata]
MADSGLTSNRRDPIKSSVGNAAASRRREHAVTVRKERRESLMRAKRLCRVGIGGGDFEVAIDSDMLIDEELSILESQTSVAVENLKSALAFQGKVAVKKRVGALQELRRLLSRSEFPPVESALKAGAVPILVQCLSFGSPDEQLLEAAWCLTNIAAGNPEETKALLPALPLLIAHLGEKSYPPVAEQCAWALGNVAGEGDELRNVLLVQGALLPLARMMLPDRGSTVRTAAWALSNLIKGPDPKAATELVRAEGVLEAIIRHLRKSDDELATEVAWVVVYLSALSNIATNMLLKSDVLELLVNKLSTSNSLPLMIPILRSLGNLIAGDSHAINGVLIPGREITGNAIEVLVKCLNCQNRVLKKEAAWVLSNIAAGLVEHKQLIYSSEAVPLLLKLLYATPFDIRKEVAYVLGNLCVAPTKGDGKPSLILEHMVSLVEKGCLPGFIDLIRSADIEAARLGLQFTELVLRGMPNGEGPKLVEQEDGIEAMERFQFHENEDLRTMANTLVDKYFGEDYGLDV